MFYLAYTPPILATWHFQPLSTFLFVGLLILFIVMLANNRVLKRRIRHRLKQTQQTGFMMKEALEISQNNVVRYDIRDRHIYTLYGNLYPQEGISLEEWMSRIHPDDLERALQHFRDIIYGSEKQVEFQYRWNFDNSGTSPRWGYMYDISVAEFRPGFSRPISIISTLRDETQLQQALAEESELMDKYRIIFENSIIGLSFYDAEGWLMDTNQMMRDICHFDSEDYDGHFSETNLFDASPFRECCDRNNLQELWICTQSIVPERDIHDYLEIRLHPIRDDQGTLVYIAIAARNITEERELYLQAKQNDMEIQKANELITNYEVELNYMMEACNMQPWRINFDDMSIEFYKGLSTVAYRCSLGELQQMFLHQDDEVVKVLTHPQEYFSKPVTWIGQAVPFFSHQGDSVWVQVNSIPEYDEDGRQTGCFGLWRNVDKLMTKQEELKRETERANDSVRLKSVFLANMTHEIRTPLNAIVGFTDLLQAIESSEDKKEMVRVIHNNCDMLLRLINDILELSNADEDTMVFIPAEVDIAQRFEETCQSLSQRVQEPGVEFQKDNPYETCVTCVDSARIQQVVTNFVTNAVKYTHQGHIRLGYRIEERMGQTGIYMYCEDTGSGIPKNQLERIFERFVKLNDYIQGTGLGLSICKVIVEKCGGQIGVESEEGKGSTFWFWIPVKIKELKVKN